ncbi:DUF6123 family protein [Bacillus sp. FJAT-47783]|uniref:DUF6123 family protein n=1 Tax=Bacillus sp. FJAT-47783 TaxID=2922712 RepID=UPI001FAC6498|nr:DUF6123 family protein [Bacillus sp. FJAT-47783]
MSSELNNYLSFLYSKGFRFGEDFLGFIQFGKGYTNANDKLLIAAIEITLKVQKSFDGAFFIALLETFQQEGIKGRQEALSFAKRMALLR